MLEAANRCNITALLHRHQTRVDDHREGRKLADTKPLECHSVALGMNHGSLPLPWTGELEKRGLIAT